MDIANQLKNSFADYENGCLTISDWNGFNEQLEALSIDEDQDWENETSTHFFKDGSFIIFGIGGEILNSTNKRLSHMRNETELFKKLIKGCYAVRIDFTHFCPRFDLCESLDKNNEPDGGFYDMPICDGKEFEINFTPELLETVSVDSDGTWTIGDMKLEFFELKKVK